MLLKNAKLYKGEDLKDLSLRDGTIRTIAPAGNVTGSREEQVIDLEGKLVLPPYVEPHIHLDYVLTAGTPRWNESGSVFEGIEIWSERRSLMKETKEDIKIRAKKAIEMQLRHGIQHVRTHADISDPELTGLKALLELKEEVKKWMDVQIVALPQEGMYTKENGEDLLRKALDMGADVVGGIPHYELTREDGIRSLETSMALAKEYGKLVDIHCDEIDDEQARYLETLAALTIRNDMQGKVTASHTAAMASYNDAYTYKLFQTLKKADVQFIALPKANLHLQGRFDSHPVRRGVTRVKEMWKEGINVCFGLDSIMDPWYPLGNGDLMSVVDTGLHACHMTDYDHITKALDLVTVNGARTLSLSDYGLREGSDANLIVLDSVSDYEAVRTQAGVLYSIRHGEVIVETKPAVTAMNISLH
ncbi:cytosine deaminase [Salimicrobium jeotgali]|uniref:Cytosine deaminase n=1 Tax=Salimicrobium jeotgali TaxID=1230341 RepID=K2G919_9BACI|nr:cytosine deaminase [Salimicrobium jeotgali]AKG04912.1 cytosine deaminase [Salimicrobium jeotgali]EKE31583.1 cytosine deaminase [Salimicrobium jeotgali]MBM7696404.1 cytosine deaminase [Salimicrobium jeotgali]